MAERHPGPWVLRDVLPRLKCSHCGGRPKVIALLEDAAGEGVRGGPNPGWRIDFNPVPPFDIIAVRPSSRTS